MSFTLFQHNSYAYRAALSMLRETGKAAVIHPTGTGKSFIGFKLCEDFPEKRFCWLSPSEYIFRTQLENLAAAGGSAPENITFITYAKLMTMSGGEIGELRPDCIILDEFHRCGAEQWGQGVQTLLKTYPDAPLLGLSATNIRYLDNQRDMAAVLFDGNVASEITLGEAIARGILKAPTYVLSIYSYKKDLKRYEERVRRNVNRPNHDKAEELLEALRRSLEDADGLDEIFMRHMQDKHGKYIVFCANAEHMEDMIRQVPEWFGGIDRETHIYRAYSPDPATRQAFKDFQEDGSEHLKLLFTIDMLNEGIHVADVDGVILFRPTVSPIIYKQQIGRALSAGSDKTPVIFDIVNNIESLYSIGTVKDEFEDALLYYKEDNGQIKKIRDRFRIIDEVRDCRQLFEQLNDALTTSWEDMYRYAKDYYEEHGNLNIPNQYRARDGTRLGGWIATQRLVKKGLRRGVLSKERIAKLDAIGMVWQVRLDGWTAYYEAAEVYRRENGDLLVPSGYIASSGVNLGNWISNVRSLRKRGMLTRKQVAALDNLGMEWDVLKSRWERQYQAARRYSETHGNLKVPVAYVDEDGIPLGLWLARVRKSYAKGKLSGERIERLNAIGMTWNGAAERWEQMYRAAENYYRTHGDLLVEQYYVDESRLALGNWIQRNRQQYRKGALSTERIAKLEAIGMAWDYDEALWRRNYRAATEYYQTSGDLNVPMKYCTPEGICLGSWIGNLRRAYKNGNLQREKIESLEAIGMVWSIGRGRPSRAASRSKTRLENSQADVMNMG